MHFCQFTYGPTCIVYIAYLAQITVGTLKYISKLNYLNESSTKNLFYLNNHLHR